MKIYIVSYIKSLTQNEAFLDSTKSNGSVVSLIMQILSNLDSAVF